VGFLKVFAPKVKQPVDNCKRLIYLSLNRAGRFSAKAAMPSFWSSAAKVA
jgi:hypothetical protein